VGPSRITEKNHWVFRGGIWEERKELFPDEEQPKGTGVDTITQRGQSTRPSSRSSIKIRKQVLEKKAVVKEKRISIKNRAHGERTGSIKSGPGNLPLPRNTRVFQMGTRRRERRFRGGGGGRMPRVELKEMHVGNAKIPLDCLVRVLTWGKNSYGLQKERDTSGGPNSR